MEYQFRNWFSIKNYPDTIKSNVKYVRFVSFYVILFSRHLYPARFLEWGWVGGFIFKSALKNITLVDLIGMSNDSPLTPEKTPKQLKDSPIKYLGQEVVISAWHAKLWSLYHFDPEVRPLYHVPVTVGFAKAVVKTHNRFKALNENHRAVTSKPFLLITGTCHQIKHTKCNIASIFCVNLMCLQLITINCFWSQHAEMISSSRATRWRVLTGLARRGVKLN